MLNFYDYHKVQLNGYDKLAKALTIVNRAISRTNRTIQFHELYEQCAIVRHIVARTTHAAVDFAVLTRERFIEAEPNIKKDPYAACMYARHVIRGRWIEAEPYIKQDTWWWDGYKEDWL